MAGIFDLYGAPQFDIEDCKIAVWNGDGSWGSLVDVPAIREVRITPVTVNKQLPGDAKIAATHSRYIGWQVLISFGSLSFNALDVITVAQSRSSGTAPNRTREMSIGAEAAKYFGMMCRSDAAEGIGDTWAFLPKMKVMQGFVVDFKNGEFAMPDLNADALIDDTYIIGGIAKGLVLQLHETAKPITVFPPTYP